MHLGILLTLIIGTLMAALDSSIVNVSLPTMMRHFNCRIDEIEWVVSAYLIGFAIVMPLTQWLKDRCGFFLLYFVSLFIFTVGSLLCGLADTLPLLIVARIIQALGGGALTPTAMAILSTIYPPEERGKVLGWWGLGVIVGPALGPTLGGILTEHFGWPSIFLVNIPIGILGLWLTIKYLKPLSHARMPGVPFDAGGFISLTIFLISTLYGISRLEHERFLSATTLSLATLSVVSFIAFLRFEKRHSHPLIDLTLFKRRPFVACLLVHFIRSAILLGGVFLMPFLLQGVHHYTETQSGLVMLPGALVVAALMPISGKWSDKRGVRTIALIGLILLAVSMGIFALLPETASTIAVLIPTVLRGVGLGLLITPISVATVNAVPKEEIALASSLSSLVQQVAASVGVTGVAVQLQFLRNQGATEAHAVNASFLTVSLLALVAIVPALYLPAHATTRKDIPLEIIEP